MLTSIVGNYIIHLLMTDSRLKCKKKVKKFLLFVGISGNLLLLFYFKYYNFIIANINKIWDSGMTVKEILLPLGISFFTFQQISFLADTYREEMDRCKIVDYTLFVSFFPQLIAGPIVTHEEMFPQFEKIGKYKRGEEEQKIFLQGIYVFVLGLTKKVIIADTFGRAVNYAYGNVEGINGLESFLVILFYSLQLYFDFSGYCDMAKGIGALFGIAIVNNFNSPYKAGNIIDFWKRWHITLSRFFTKNIYIPLGGNRKGKARTYANLFLVFFLSGVWHGAGWNFILWGILHGGLYIITRSCQDWMNNNKYRRERAERPFLVQLLLRIKGSAGRLFTFFYVCIAWVYFRASTVEQANNLLKNLWTKSWVFPTDTFLDFFNLGEFWYPMKVMGITRLPYAKGYLMIGFLAVSLVITFFGKNVIKLEEEFRPGVVNACFCAILFIWSVVSLSGVSTFLYFNF